jgi:hypothetical protein
VDERQTRERQQSEAIARYSLQKAQEAAALREQEEARKAESIETTATDLGAVEPPAAAEVTPVQPAMRAIGDAIGQVFDSMRTIVGEVAPEPTDTSEQEEEEEGYMSPSRSREIRVQRMHERDLPYLSDGQRDAARRYSTPSGFWPPNRSPHHPDVSGHRHCAWCLDYKWLDADHFYADSKSPGGFDVKCKTCRVMRQWSIQDMRRAAVEGREITTDLGFDTATGTLRGQDKDTLTHTSEPASTYYARAQFAPQPPVTVLRKPLSYGQKTWLIMLGFALFSVAFIVALMTLFDGVI